MDINLNTEAALLSTKNQAVGVKVKIPKSDSPTVFSDDYVSAKVSQPEVYDFRGKILSSENEMNTLLDSFDVMKKSVEQQMDKLFGIVRANSDDENLVGKAEGELRDYFKTNPEALEEVNSGQIPEYWNRENTAKRMFSTVMMGFGEGMDRSEFFDKAVKTVNQSYSEVESEIGMDLPGLVLDTKSTLLDALNQFKDGTAIGEIAFA